MLPYGALCKNSRDWGYLNIVIIQTDQNTEFGRQGGGAVLYFIGDLKRQEINAYIEQEEKK